MGKILSRWSKEKKPSRRGCWQLDSCGLEGAVGEHWPQGGGGEVLGSVLSQIDLDLNVKTCCQKLSVTGSSLESNERLNCYISFKGIAIILGGGRRQLQVRNK